MRARAPGRARRAACAPHRARGAGRGEPSRSRARVPRGIPSRPGARLARCRRAGLRAPGARPPARHPLGGGRAHRACDSQRARRLAQRPRLVGPGPRAPGCRLCAGGACRGSRGWLPRSRGVASPPAARGGGGHRRERAPRRARIAGRRRHDLPRGGRRRVQAAEGPRARAGGARGPGEAARRGAGGAGRASRPRRADRAGPPAGGRRAPRRRGPAAAPGLRHARGAVACRDGRAAQREPLRGIVHRRAGGPGGGPARCRGRRRRAARDRPSGARAPAAGSGRRRLRETPRAPPRALPPRAAALRAGAAGLVAHACAPLPLGAGDRHPARHRQPQCRRRAALAREPRPVARRAARVRGGRLRRVHAGGLRGRAARARRRGVPRGRVRGRSRDRRVPARPRLGAARARAVLLERGTRGEARRLALRARRASTRRREPGALRLRGAGRRSGDGRRDGAVCRGVLPPARRAGPQARGPRAARLRARRGRSQWRGVARTRARAAALPALPRERAPGAQQAARDGPRRVRNTGPRAPRRRASRRRHGRTEACRLRPRPAGSGRRRRPLPRPRRGPGMPRRALDGRDRAGHAPGLSQCGSRGDVGGPRRHRERERRHRGDRARRRDGVAPAGSLPCGGPRPRDGGSRRGRSLREAPGAGRTGARGAPPFAGVHGAAVSFDIRDRFRRRPRPSTVRPCDR